MVERSSGLPFPEKTRIAFMNPYPNDHVGGVGDIARSQYDYVKGHGEDNGWEARLYSPRRHNHRTDFGESIPLGVAFRASPKIFKTEAWLTLIDFRENMKHADLANWADILILHEPEIYMDTAAVTLLRSVHSRKKSMATLGILHAKASQERLLKYKLLSYAVKELKLVDQAITNTPEMKRWAEKFLPWKFEVVENPVDTKKFHLYGERLDAINGFTLDGNRVNILYLGRLEQRKGLSYAIDSVAKVARDPDGPKNFRFVIAGDGPDSSMLRNKVKELGLEDFVVFVGIVSEADKPKLYRTADFCFFPSYIGESFGNVLLEAMASGKPVLAGMGYSDFLVKHGENGFLLKSTNPTESAEYLLKLIQGAENITGEMLRDRMGFTARLFSESFDIEHNVKKLLVIAQRVLEEKARKRSVKSQIFSIRS